MARVQVGDRVYVNDPGLAQLRDIMRRATGKEPPPNHYGIVDALWDDAEGTVLITFDEDGVVGAGNSAPYPIDDVFPLVEETPR
jgi:hypothetical protein